MKIKFRSDDDLDLNKMLELPNIVIVVGSVFNEGNKYYPQFTEKNVSINYKC